MLFLSAQHGGQVVEHRTCALDGWHEECGALTIWSYELCARFHVLAASLATVKGNGPRHGNNFEYSILDIARWQMIARLLLAWPTSQTVKRYRTIRKVAESKVAIKSSDNLIVMKTRIDTYCFFPGNDRLLDHGSRLELGDLAMT